MNYVRLVRGNDWGNYYFTLPGKNLTEHRMADAKLGLRFSVGQPIRVRWPDGSETEETIDFKEESYPVNDMGHRYEVHNRVPGILAGTRGFRHWVAIDSIDVCEDDLRGPIAK